jgi:hypothetical protein
MSVMSAEQRYWNAIRKSSLLAGRAVRQWQAGEIDYIDGDFDRKCLVSALERAFEDGRKTKG